MGSSQPLLHAAGPSPVVASSPPCRIQQRTPLYVGFPDDVALDSFEQTALASHAVVRAVKHWGCGASTRPAAAISSLQLAFARSAPIRLDRLQFDDRQLLRAHVVLSSAVAERDRLHWRVELLQRPEAGWAVTQTQLASSRDLAEP